MAPVISLLVPSRGRPDQLSLMWATALETSNGPIELVYRLDDDDNEHYPQLPYSTRLSGPRVVLSAMWNECADAATGGILMHCGDDIRFRSDGWDSAVRWAFEEYPDRIALVHGRDGIHDANMATHGFLHRRWVETVGYFVPPLFSSDYNDTWLTEVADMIGRRCYLPEVYTEHMHPAVGKGELDQTHRDRLQRHHQDDVDGLYRSTHHLRVADADKLRAVIEAAA